MFSESEFYADIFLCFEPRTMPNLGPHSSVILDIKGRNRKVSLVIPTCPVPQHVSLTTCDRWVEIIQGPVLSRCGIKDDQREVLLHLALAYRAFVRGIPGTTGPDWARFSSQLVIIVCEVSPMERIDDHLREVLEWLHAILPVCIFLDDTIPSIIYNDAPPPDDLEHTVVEAEGMDPEDQTMLRLHLEANIYDLISHTLPTVPRGTPTEDFPPALLHYARELDARHADTGFIYSPVPVNLTTLSDSVGTLNGSEDMRLYLTLEIPACLFGSMHTLLANLIQQCIFHKVNPDGTTELLPSPLAIPVMPAVAAPDPSTPPTAPSTLPTASNTPHTQPTAGDNANLAMPAYPSLGVSASPLLGVPRTTSSPQAAQACTRALATARIRRSPLEVQASIARHRAVTEARQARQREERAARAATRTAIRMAAHATGDDSADSDDSIPSLMTVTDSSDGVMSELDLAYPGDD